MSIKALGNRRGNLPEFVYVYFSNPREFMDEARKFRDAVKVEKIRVQAMCR
jgi:hypothetical protein